MILFFFSSERNCWKCAARRKNLLAFVQQLISSQCLSSWSSAYSQKCRFVFRSYSDAFVKGWYLLIGDEDVACVLPRYKIEWSKVGHRWLRRFPAFVYYPRCRCRWSLRRFLHLWWCIYRRHARMTRRQSRSRRQWSSLSAAEQPTALFIADSVQIVVHGAIGESLTRGPKWRLIIFTVDSTIEIEIDTKTVLCNR